MKKNFVLCILLLLAVFSSCAFAGTEPSPFQPEINTLMSVVNELNSIETLIQHALTLPANEVGLTNQMETMANKLTILNNKVEAVQKNLDWPLEDQEVSDAFLLVQDNTQDIVNISNEVLSWPPDPITPELLEALESLNLEAISLVNQLLEPYHRINLLLPYPPSDPRPPIEFPEDVTTFVLHGWVTGGSMGEMPALPYWSEMTSEQQNEYLDTASFTLSVDGVPVELSRLQWYEDESDEMYVAYYSVFLPYTFTEGDAYTFEGFWSVEFNNVQYTYSETRTIILC